MGRYAFFTTGIEYKFKFGIQSSSDMLDFEGLSYYGTDDDRMIHIWKKTDEVKIKQKLYDFFQNEIDLTKFQKNIDGTSDLREHLETITDDYTMILGYMIYHQLQYVDELRVDYEI